MIPRLYTIFDLLDGQSIPLLDGQHHYLKNVLRLKAGDHVLLFNGRDGEWRAHIAHLGKKDGILALQEKTRLQSFGPDLWLLFAPIKRGRLEWLVEKAAELGVSAVQPVLTQHCEIRKLNDERLQAHLVEAAEQCERLDVPEYRPAVTLNALLEAWPEDRRLLVCAEKGEALPISDVLARNAGKTSGFLIGPEGGFSGNELALLKAKPYVDLVSLGPRVLRADTAVCAALSCWQAICGDWREARN